MKKLALLLLALLPLALSAKNYEIRAEVAIESVVNASEADVELIYSPAKANTIVYSSPEVEPPVRITVNRRGKVSISTMRKHSYKISKIKIYYSGQISEIVNSGTGDVETASINAPIDLKLVNSGTGDIDIKKINVKKLSISNSGTGDVDIDGGKTVAIKIINSGTGDVKAKTQSATAEIVNSGTGDIVGLRESTTAMKITNTGTGKVTIKENSASRPEMKTTGRNIRYIK